MNNPFVIYHNYSDGSGKPIIVYIGTDKAAAFDTLWEFLMSDNSQGMTGLSMKTAPTSYMTAAKTLSTVLNSENKD